MKAVIGLGNPGKKYERTRHNVGFLVVDHLAEGCAPGLPFKKKFKADYLKVTLSGEEILLIKPQSYMNLSGEPIRSILGYFKIAAREDPQDILVVYDDLDLPFGQLRFRERGSAGGHNGIKSTIDHLGTRDFHRLKFGIGRDPRIDPAKFVLSQFDSESLVELKRFVERASEAVNSWVRRGLKASATEFNGSLNHDSPDKERERDNDGK